MLIQLDGINWVDVISIIQQLVNPDDEIPTVYKTREVTRGHNITVGAHLAHTWKPRFTLPLASQFWVPAKVGRWFAHWQTVASHYINGW
jgi:hypothetical protein